MIKYENNKRSLNDFYNNNNNSSQNFSGSAMEDYKHININNNYNNHYPNQDTNFLMNSN
jgi:hypothetical protein